MNASVTIGNGALTYTPAAGTVLDAGTHTLSVTAAETANFNEATETVSITVDRLGLVGSFTAANKMVDGNNSATVTGYSVATKVGSDDVNISGGTATFADALAASGKTVTLTGATLTGAAKENYSLTFVNTTTATIFASLVVSVYVIVVVLSLLVVVSFLTAMT